MSNGPIDNLPETEQRALEAFTDAYRQRWDAAFGSVDMVAFGRAQRLIASAYETGATVFVCGNGGSAAIANHLHCDHLKGIRSRTGLKPRVVSLCTAMPAITAVANDTSYAEIFAYQLQSLARPGDVLWAISSSGNSANIVMAVEWAKENDIKVVGFTGFSGGRLAQDADVSIHVDAGEYEVVEDVHQSLANILAQYIGR
ncbi:MAG: SIS domain-containing protein [Rhodospirillales bacterium]